VRGATQYRCAEAPRQAGGLPPSVREEAHETQAEETQVNEKIYV